MKRFNKTIWITILLALFGGLLYQTHTIADVGDIGVYRDAEGGADEDNQTYHDEGFDTVVHEDNEFTSTGTLITLDSGGHYFVWYALNFRVASGGGSDRTVHLSRMDVEGTISRGGYGQGYTRAAGSELEAYLSGGSIIEASAGDDLHIEARNASNNVGESLETRANLNGVSVLKLDDDWDYLRIYEQGGGTNYNNGAMTDYTWDRIDEMDTGSFDFTAHTSNVTLKKAGHYLVTYGIRLLRASNSIRMQMQSQVILDGVDVQEQCHSGTYIRGNLAGDIIVEGAISGVCIVEVTAGQELEVQIQRGSTNVGTSITDVGGESGMTIVKLPDDADYVRIYDDDGTQGVNATDEPILWGANSEVDSAFTHSTVTNTDDITVNEDGHYLFTSCIHAGRVASTVRYPYIHQWRVDGTTIQYGNFGAYNRGDNGAYDSYQSSNCGALILDDLTDGQDVDVTITDEGGGAAGEPTLTINEAGVTGLYINSLFRNIEGTSDLSNGTTLRLAVNGTLLSATSDVSGGVFSIPVGVDHITSGDVVTVWADGEATANEATAVTKYDGTGDITGLVLNKHQLTIGSADNQSLTVTDLGQYDNDDDEDIMHVVSGGTLKVDADDVYTDDEIEIKASNTLTIGVSERLNVHDVDNNGSLVVSGAGKIVIDGSWDNAASATFTSASGDVVFAGSSTETITSNGDAFNNVHIDDGLVGYWRFEESATPSLDYSGYGNDGIWQAGATTDTTIPSVNFANARSLVLDGTDDRVDVGTPIEIQNLSNGFTVAGWVRADSLAGTHQIFSADTSSSDNGFGFGTNGSNLTFSVHGGTDLTASSSGLSTGTWTHVAVVFDSSDDANFYVDGGSAEVVAGAASVTANTDDNWHIGANQNTTEEWQGRIDDLRIYNRELTSTEIGRLAAGNTPAITGSTYSLQDALDVNGDLSLHAGTLDVNAKDITLTGDWLNTGGVFDDETRTVTLDGDDQAIEFSETFSNLTKSIISTGTLTIGKDSTITVAGALSLSGVSGNLLGVASSTIGTKHTWDVTAGDQSLNFLNVKDSQASSNDIIATFSTNIGRNDDEEASPHWIFSSTFYWVGTSGGDTNSPSNWSTTAGACGVSGGAGVPGATDVATFQANCDNNATVDVTLNVAALDIQSGYTGTITPNSSIEIDVDGPFSMADGTLDLSANNTDLKVSGNFTKTGGTITAGSGVTTFDGALTVTVDGGTDLGNVTISSSPDISVTIASDVTVDDLTIGSGDTLVTDGYELTIDADLDLNGVLNATNGTDGNTTIDVDGNWDATGGTFTNTNSIVRFTGGSGTSDLISAGEVFKRFNH